MTSILKPKKSTTPGAVPTTANLADGEVAVNTADRRIFVRVGADVVAVANYSDGGGTGVGVEAVAHPWEELTATTSRTLTNNTAMQDWFASPSSLVLDANSEYEFEGYFCSTNGTTSHGLNMQFAAVSGATIQWSSIGAKTVAATQATAVRKVDTNTFATSRNVTTASTVAGNSVLVQGRVVTTTAGSLQPQMAQSAASGSFIVLAGSYFRVRKVGTKLVGGLADAPSDGKTYGRKDAAWNEVKPVLGGNSLTGSFDPALLGSGVTLSGGNKDATFTSSQRIACVTPVYAGGIRYVEITFTSGSSSADCSIGVMDGLPANLAHQIGYDGPGGVGEVGMFQNTGNFYINTAGSGSGAAFSTAGDVVGVAVSGRSVWFRVNGGNWNGSSSNSPITGVGGKTLTGSGAIYVGVCSSASGAKFTVNTGATLAGATPWGEVSLAGYSQVADVNVTSPANNEVLTYDSATSKWINKAASGGGGGGLPWSTVAVNTTMTAGNAYNVTGARDMACGSAAVGDFFVVHAVDATVRVIAGTGREIRYADTLVVSGATDALTLAKGETVWLACAVANKLEIV